MLLGWALIQSDQGPSKKKSEHRGDTTTEEKLHEGKRERQPSSNYLLTPWS